MIVGLTRVAMLRRGARCAKSYLVAGAGAALMDCGAGRKARRCGLQQQGRREEDCVKQAALHKRTAVRVDEANAAGR